LSLVVAGCRAQVDAPDGGLDGGDDAHVGDDMMPDLLGADLFCAGNVPEICGNGCDDDHNGYVDDDDPACTTQLLVTPKATGVASPALQRLVLEPTPHLVNLDGNPVPSGAMPELNAAFAPPVFLSVDGNQKLLRTLHLDPSGTGTFSDFSTTFSTRDACVYNGELIVVDATGFLHRFTDGSTENADGGVGLGNVIATACASDGNLLYVAVHDLVGNPTQFLVFDKTFTQQGPAIDLPTAISGAGLDRCVDFAWTRHGGGFYGLFVTAGATLNDSKLDGSQLYPFAFDGGAGAPIDAGTFHGLGEFLP
jgi:hypothetical protein